jgi:TonB family protein
MKSLSLDLRRLEPLPEQFSETPAKSAVVSLLAHAGGIGALIIIPLLGASVPPETANTFSQPLVAPILVALPPPPPPRQPPAQGPQRPAAVAAAAAPSARPLTEPVDTPTSLSFVGDVLEPSTGIVPGRPGTDGQAAGDCVLGALCGTGPVGVAEPGPPQTPRIGGVIREPRLISSRSAQYPPLAQATGVSGQVILEAHVSEHGRVLEVRIVEGHALFTDAALTSVRTRVYEPLLLNGVRSDFLVTITMAFNIRR